MAIDERIGRMLEECGEDCTDSDLEEKEEELAELGNKISGDTSGEVSTLSALADRTRLQLAKALAAVDGELCVCELDALTEVSESAVSHALSKLREAGLVDRRREGRWRYYSTTEKAENLLAALEEGK